MKSKKARDAITSFIDNELKEGLHLPREVQKYGNSNRTLLDTLSSIFDKPFTLEHQMYLNERKSKNMKMYEVCKEAEATHVKIIIGKHKTILTKEISKDYKGIKRDKTIFLKIVLDK